MLFVASLFGVLAAGSVTLLSLGEDDEAAQDAEADTSEDETAEGPARVSVSQFLFGSDDDVGEDNDGTDIGPLMIDPLPPSEEPPGPVTDSPAPPATAVLTGTEGLDQMQGGDGDDTLSGLGGDDQIHGAAGDDSLSGGTGDDQVHGGDGADTVSGGAGSDLLHGEAKADVLSGDDTLFGHFGHDSLWGGSGNDEAHGGQDDDSLHGGDGADSLHGNDGDDGLHGGSGQDALFGGAGHDFVNGADDSTADFINGGAGNDLLAVGAGDVVTGGDGADNILLGDWIAGGTVELVDYNATEDQLMVVYDAARGAPEVEVSADPEHPDQMIVSLDGTLAIYLQGAEGLTAADIRLVEATGEDLRHLPLG